MVDGCMSRNGENEVFCNECDDNYGNNGCKKYMFKYNLITFDAEKWCDE